MPVLPESLAMNENFSLKVLKFAKSKHKFEDIDSLPMPPITKFDNKNSKMSGPAFNNSHNSNEDEKQSPKVRSKIPRKAELPIAQVRMARTRLNKQTSPALPATQAIKTPEIPESYPVSISAFKPVNVKQMAFQPPDGLAVTADDNKDQANKRPPQTKILYRESAKHTPVIPEVSEKKLEEKIMVEEKNEPEPKPKVYETAPAMERNSFALFEDDLFGQKTEDGTIEVKTTTIRRKTIAIHSSHPLQRARQSEDHEKIWIEDENDLDELLEEGFSHQIKNMLGSNTGNSNIFQHLLQMSEKQKMELKKSITRDTLLKENKKLEKFFRNQYEFLTRKPGEEKDEPPAKIMTEIIKFGYYFNQELSDMKQTNTERLQEALKIHSELYVNRRRDRRPEKLKDLKPGAYSMWKAS